MFLSNFAEIAFLNAMRGQNFPAPSSMYVGLFLTSPTETGTSGIEVSYVGYSRQLITFAAPTSTSGGIGIRNNTQITFPKSQADAGTITFKGIFDSVVGGNMYMYGNLTESMPIVSGESPVLLINETLFFSTGDITNAYKTKLFNVFRGTTLNGFSPYIGLWNGDPESGGSELAGANYSRVPVVFSAPSEDVSGSSVISNSVANQFNRATTTWGTWNHTVIHDAQSGGTPVWRQAVTSKSIISGIMPYFEPNGIVIGIN